MTGFTHPATWVHLDWVLVIVVAWLLTGVLGVFALRRFRLVATVLFPASGLRAWHVLWLPAASLTGVWMGLREEGAGPGCGERAELVLRLRRERECHGRRRSGGRDEGGEV